MNDLNKFMAIGRFTQDPNCRSIPNGDRVADWSIACNWKRGEKEGVEYINCVAFRVTAELIEKYCRRGSRVYVEGGLRTRKWEKPEGNGFNYKTEIVVNTIQFLDTKKDNDGFSSEPRNYDGQQQNAGYSAQNPGGNYTPYSGAQNANNGMPPAPEDDLPF